MNDVKLKTNPQSLILFRSNLHVWFDPFIVLEVTGAELSVSPIHTAAEGVFKEDAGLGLRFPRFTGRVRDDKGPEESTSVGEVIEMYEMQRA